MIYREYGKTGKKISLIGFGTTRFSGSHEDMEHNIQLVVDAVKNGINYFDTAPTYASGKSDEILALALQEIKQNDELRQNDIYISSKSMLAYDPGESDVQKRIEQTLRTIGIDKINFFHMWSVLNLEQYRKIRAKGGPLDGALKAKEQGLIEHICFSAHCGGDEIIEILNDDVFEGVTLSFNAVNYRYNLRTLQVAGEKKIGVAVMNPLAGGMIPNNLDYFRALDINGDGVVKSALQFVVSHKNVTSALVGMRAWQELNDAVEAISEPLKFEDETRWDETAEKIMSVDRPVCTMCQYCKGCPKNIKIHEQMGAYNQYILTGNNETEFVNYRLMRFLMYPYEEIDCIKCGKCEKKCTQHLPIIKRLEEINAIAEKYKSNFDEMLSRLFPDSGYPPTAFYGLTQEVDFLINYYQYKNGKALDLHFFDSNPAKWNTKTPDGSATIQPPSEIKSSGVKRIFILSKKYAADIRKTILQYVSEEEVEICEL